MLKRIVLGLGAAFVTLVGIYLFTLGGAYTIAGAALYVGIWIAWLVLRRHL